MSSLRAGLCGSSSSSSSSATPRRRNTRPLVSASSCAFPRARRDNSRAPSNPQSTPLAASTPRAPENRRAPRQSKQALPAATVAELAAVDDAASSPEQDAEDRRWMAVALEQARLAGERGEVPIGAVVVVAGQEPQAGTAPTEGGGALLTTLGLPRGNEVLALCDPTAHAEMLALRSALSALQSQGISWRSSMQRATLYATCEPCPMCAGAALACRVGRVVYGARQPRVGADGSWASLLRAPAAVVVGGGGGGGGEDRDQEEEVEEEEEEEGEQATRRQQPPPPPNLALPLPHPYHPNLEVRSGVRADEAAALLRDFFRRRRRERSEEQQQ